MVRMVMIAMTMMMTTMIMTLVENEMKCRKKMPVITSTPPCHL